MSNIIIKIPTTTGITRKVSGQRDRTSKISPLNKCQKILLRREGTPLIGSISPEWPLQIIVVEAAAGPMRPPCACVSEKKKTVTTVNLS